VKKLLWEMTHELGQAIDLARGDRDRGPSIEEWLWSVPAIRRAAKDLGIEKPARPKPGRKPKRGKP